MADPSVTQGPGDTSDWEYLRDCCFEHGLAGAEQRRWGQVCVNVHDSVFSARAIVKAQFGSTDPDLVLGVVKLLLAEYDALQRRLAAGIDPL